MAANITNKIVKTIEKRTDTKEGAMRYLAFILGLSCGLIGYPLHFLGVWGSREPFLLTMSVLTEAILIAIALLYHYNKISLFRAMETYGFLMTVIQSVKIVYIAYTAPVNGQSLIIFNSVICLLVVFLLASGYMNVISFYLTGINILTFIAIRLIRPDSIQSQFIIFFVFIELLDCFLGIIAWRCIRQVEQENKDYREEESGLLSAFNMKREELIAYINMSKASEQTKKDVKAFFDNLDERSEYNIITAVKDREQAVALANADIAKAFPFLSPTEVDVCRLVVSGKKLNEVARLMGKTANNISSVRNHIRKKLDLASGQDLRLYLQEKMAEGKEHSSEKV